MKKLVLFVSILLCYQSMIIAEGHAHAPAEGFSAIVEPLIPAVVNVYTSKHRRPTNIPELQNPLNDPFLKFFEQFDIPFSLEELYGDPKAMALGSGFIIDPTGYVVTNNHVIAGADEISVKLNDNTELPAKLIGSDHKTDIALLKIESTKPLPSVKFGDSTRAKVGDWVIAIGNPFGLGGTVTTGIISSKGRDVIAGGIVDDFIQTDAAVNMGNSGGPMFNLAGEVIGVNTAIFSSTGSNVGIGFAIPSSTVKHVVDTLKTYGKVSRGMLGVKIQEITSNIAEAMSLPFEEGVLVVEADPKGAGSKAGLKAGDVIVQINDTPIKNSRKLQIVVAETPINSSIKITVYRSGAKHELTCKITETDDQLQRKEPFKKSDTTNYKVFEIHGVTFANIVEDIRDEMTSGIVVHAIKPSATWNILRRGDIILSINQHPISSIKEFEEIYNKAVATTKKHVVLFIKRRGAKLFMALPL